MRKIMVLLGLCLSTPLQALDFPHYVLALTWHAEFCQQQAFRAECRAAKTSDFAASELVLHGLWPNGGKQDEYCGLSRADMAAARSGDWCDIASLGLADPVQKTLRVQMPGSHPQSCLQRYEWTKHGSCSGLSPTAYYQLSNYLVSEFAKTEFSDFIADNRGREVQRRDAFAQINREFGPNSSWKFQLICRSGYLTELRVWLDADIDTNTPFKRAITRDRVDAKARCGRSFRIRQF